jgi:hypothetical protein
LSLANTSFGTHNANNTSANHFDTTARTATGMITNQMPSGSTLTMTQDGSLVMNNQGAISNLGTTVNLASAIRSTAMQQADTAYSAALSHQQAYNESMSDAKRYAYELSQHESNTESHGQGYVTTTGSSESTSVNTQEQQSNSLSHDHNASERASKERTENAGLNAHGQVGASIGVMGGTASASVGANAGANWAHSLSQSEQRGYTQTESFQQNNSQNHNVEAVLRDVQEGHYRANTEEGKRLVENISASLDRAHQEQTQAAAQFQQADTYRRAASIAEENAVSINSNATQEFMTHLQHSGRSMREIEQTMVNHPEKAQAMADSFTRSKTQAFIQDFAKQSGSSSVKIIESDQANAQALSQQQKSNEPGENYRADHAQLAAQAKAAGLGSEHLVDKNLEKTTIQKIDQRKQAIEGNKKHMDQEKIKLDHKVQKNQGKLREDTGLFLDYNKIEDDKNN